MLALPLYVFLSAALPPSKSAGASADHRSRCYDSTLSITEQTKGFHPPYQALEAPGQTGAQAMAFANSRRGQILVAGFEHPIGRKDVAAYIVPAGEFANQFDSSHGSL